MAVLTEEIVPNYDHARNINIWKNAEVFISTEKDPKVNTDGSFDNKVWKFVGLLNEGSSIGQEADTERNEIKSWGGVLRLTDQKFNKDTRTFETIEDNETTFQLMYPNSKYVASGSTTIMAPEDAKVFIAFKTTNSWGDVVIDASRLRANVYPSNTDKNDDGASTTEFTAEIRKDDKDALYDRLTIKGTGETTVVSPEVIRIKQDSRPEPGSAGLGDSESDSDSEDH